MKPKERILDSSLFFSSIYYEGRVYILSDLFSCMLFRTAFNEMHKYALNSLQREQLSNFCNISHVKYEDKIFLPIRHSFFMNLKYNQTDFFL